MTAEQATTSSPPPQRRDEEIALDLMRFIAESTNYARGSTKGFRQGEAESTHTEEQTVQRLLELYRTCVSAVRGR
jgi:hypothetical protein